MAAIRCTEEFHAGPYDLFQGLAGPVAVADPPLLALQYYAFIARTLHTRPDTDIIRQYRRSLRGELARYIIIGGKSERRSFWRVPNMYLELINLLKDHSGGDIMR